MNSVNAANYTPLALQEGLVRGHRRRWTRGHRPIFRAVPAWLALVISSLRRFQRRMWRVLTLT